MPKTASIPATARVAPYLPLRGRTFMVNPENPEMKRLIKYFGGQVVKSNRYAAYKEGRIIVEDKDSLPRSVKTLLDGGDIRPDNIWDEDQQIESLFQLHVEGGAPHQGVKLLHRNTLFYVRSKVFKPVGQRLDAAIVYSAPDDYEQEAVRDIMAIKFNRRTSKWDDEVLRIQLCRSAGGSRWAVHTSRGTLFDLCHEDSVDAPGSLKHGLMECAHEDRALGFFKKEVCRLFRLPYFSREQCKAGTILYDSDDHQSGIAILASKFVLCV
jgi:hypothetical protein